MAKATADFRRVLDQVTLTLSGDEAQTLRDILEYIGGCPDTSRRTHTDAVMLALQGQDVYPSNKTDIRPQSSIYFC